MNQINNTEIVNRINRNLQSTANGQPKIVAGFKKFFTLLFAAALLAVAFFFAPVQAQEQNESKISAREIKKQENREQASSLNDNLKGSGSREIPEDKARGVQEKFIAKGRKGIPGQYIVVLQDWAVAGKTNGNAVTAEVSDTLVNSYGGEVADVFQDALNGFSAKMSEEEAVALSKDVRVAYVEQDQVFSLSAAQNVSGWGWGLDRIDQASRPLNGYYTYYYTGAGVNVYVIDSGIRSNHPDFGGRIVGSIDFLGGNGQDYNGHGTHVAGTIAGATVGVAKKARLISLRVFDGRGNTTATAIISAVNWVTRNHAKPAVVNMSLGGGVQQSLDDAVRRSISAGVTYVVAAGNDGIDANYVSPARVREAITVGATNQNDSRAGFGYNSQGRYLSSNYGSALDLFAPGKDIWSTSIGNANNGYEPLSGTSMAAPHVAGAAAIYLQYYPYATPAQVQNAIVGTAAAGRLNNLGYGSPNRLLDSLMQY